LKNSFSLLSVIIPVYNEERTLNALLEKVCAVHLDHGIEKELIVIDDCSHDNSVAICLAFIKAHPNISIRLIRHEENLGKGAALHHGIAAAGGEYLIIQDADLEYDPNDYHDLLQPVLNGNADVVYGSRFVGHKPHRVLYFWHTLGNKILTFCTNLVTQLNLTDMETCYKLFNTRIVQQLSLEEKRFGFEPEVTIKMSRIPNIRVYEVGISYYGRTYEEGKKIGWKDGIRALWCIGKYGLLKH